MTRGRRRRGDAWRRNAGIELAHALDGVAHFGRAEGCARREAVARVGVRVLATDEPLEQVAKI